MIGQPERASDPRFNSVAARVRNSTEWFALRQNALRGRNTDAWVEEFSRVDVPAMPCHSLESLIDDPHIRASQLLSPDHHPTEGDILAMRSTILRNGKADATGAPAAAMGADTRPVLRGNAIFRTTISSALSPVVRLLSRADQMAVYPPSTV
ncbi:MAG: CoA transferase [Rhizomicrobium sp.]